MPRKLARGDADADPVAGRSVGPQSRRSLVMGTEEGAVWEAARGIEARWDRLRERWGVAPRGPRQERVAMAGLAGGFRGFGRAPLAAYPRGGGPEPPVALSRLLGRGGGGGLVNATYWRGELERMDLPPLLEDGGGVADRRAYLTGLAGRLRQYAEGHRDYVKPEKNFWKALK